MKSLKFIVSAVLAGAVVLGVSACSTEPVDMAAVTNVIDVRTPAEFAAGHLEGAINMDVESGDFQAQVSTLDTAGKYLVYCHSGRRAGLAVDQMSSLGFKDATNIGGLEDAAASTGLPVTQ